MKKIKIINAHNYRLFRQAITQKLNAAGMYEVVAEPANEEELFSSIAGETHDVIVLGIEKKNVSRYKLGLRLLENGCKNLIIITDDIDVNRAHGMMVIGAKGFVSGNCTMDEYLSAINEVANGNKYIGNSILEKVAIDFCQRQNIDDRSGQLSKRQKQILSFLKSGFPPEKIADRLNLTTFGVRSQWHNILKKLNLECPSLSFKS